MEDEDLDDMVHLHPAIFRLTVYFYPYRLYACSIRNAKSGKKI